MYRQPLGERTTGRSEECQLAGLACVGMNRDHAGGDGVLGQVLDVGEQQLEGSVAGFEGARSGWRTC